MKLRSTSVRLVLSGLVLVSCGDQRASSAPAPAADSGAGHVHAAPHGGLLVVLAEEQLHLELILEPSSGELTAYLLGPHAHASVRTSQTMIEFGLTLAGGMTPLQLIAVASPLSGETVGDTSVFRGASTLLQGVERFEGVVRALQARGMQFEAVPFKYPG